MIRVVVRADAGPAIGSGHVMRCTALVEALRARGADVEFIGAGVPRRVVDALEAEHVPVGPPPAVHPDPRDVASVVAAARRGVADARWVIVDGYHFDAGYMRALRGAGLRIVWLDDVQLIDRFDADLVVNPTLGAERLVYTTSASTRVLAGSTYALVRRSMRARPAPAVRRPRLVIALGGADPLRLTPAVLRAVVRAGLADTDIAAVVGPSNSHVQEVRDAAAGASRVSVLEDPADWHDLVAGAALAISAAGTSTWELALLGVPMVLLVTAGNQERSALMMSEAGAADVVSGSGIDGLANRVAALWGEPSRRLEMAGRAARLVDGLGSDRVARWIVDGPQVEAVRMRPAEARDALQVWRINSEPTTRANSFDPALIPLQGHFKWFDARLGDASSRQYVFERGDELAAVARYDRQPGNHAEIGFAVASPFRGLGLASRILSETWRPACAALGVAAVRGTVIESNASSTAAFRRAGFTEVGRGPRHGRDCVVFERLLT